MTLVVNSHRVRRMLWPDWLTGKSVHMLSSPACKNILLPDLPKSNLKLRHPVPQRGVRTSRTLVRDAMDADSAADEQH